MDGSVQHRHGRRRQQQGQTNHIGAWSPWGSTWRFLRFPALPFWLPAFRKRGLPHALSKYLRTVGQDPAVVRGLHPPEQSPH